MKGASKRKTSAPVATSSLTNTTLAVAVAFLGAAALAAAAAGSMVTRGNRAQQPVKPPLTLIKADVPDLVIPKIEVGNGSYGDGKNFVIVHYQNVGKGAVGKPFVIALGTEPPATLGGSYPAETGVADKTSGLENRYNLAPGQASQMRVFLPSLSPAFSGSEFTLIAYVDYKAGDPAGNVSELSEQNNDRVIKVPVLVSAKKSENVLAPGGQEGSPEPAKKSENVFPSNPAVDPASFCATPATVDTAICNKRLSSVPGLQDSTWQWIFDKYQCAGVYRGFPIIKANEVYKVLKWDTTANVITSDSLQGCSQAAGPDAPSLKAAEACIDELHASFAKKPFYVNGSFCFKPAEFCNVTSAADPSSCRKRLEGTSLPASSWESTLNTYACSGVYKGIPIVKVGNQFAPLYLDTTANAILGMSLVGCSQASGDKAPTVEAVKKCIDELPDKSAKNGLFIKSCVQ